MKPNSGSFKKGKEHPQYGVPRTESEKIKIGEGLKGKKNGLKKPEETKKRNCGHHKAWNKGLKMSKEFCEKLKGENNGMSKMCGELNPAWNGGTAYLPYCQKFNKPLRRSVRIRDNHTCQLCNKTQKEEKILLSVHHVHYDRENCYPDIITLCRSCNLKVNKKSERKNYESLFMNKLNERGLLFWTKRNIK